MESGGDSPGSSTQRSKAGLGSSSRRQGLGPYFPGASRPLGAPKPREPTGETRRAGEAGKGEPRRRRTRKVRGVAGALEGRGRSG